jgi:starch synthase
MTERALISSDPGFLPTSRQMALAVADRLSAYWTTFTPGRLARAPGIGRELGRRTLPSELASKARTLETTTELARVALQRVGIQRFSYPLIWRRNERFDHALAALLPAGATVIGENGACLATFERALRTGGRTILDYPIARYAVGDRILQEEAALRPDFADTIGRQILKPEHLARLEAELDVAELVVVGSRFAADSFAGRIEPGRIRTISYGVDVTAFTPRSEPRRPGPLRVLFAGALTQRKGIAYVLDAMRLLDPARYELTLVGATFGSAAGLAPYEGTFRHVPWLRHDQMPDAFHDADVFVFPSLLEGSASVVLEAMASGLPVVVTPNAGADAVRDGIDGFVIPIRSAKAIAERVEQLGRDDELRERMGRAARERALEFTWAEFRRRFRAVVDADLATPADVMDGVLVA